MLLVTGLSMTAMLLLLLLLMRLPRKASMKSRQPSLLLPLLTNISDGSCNALALYRNTSKLGARASSWGSQELEEQGRKTHEQK